MQDLEIVFEVTCASGKWPAALDRYFDVEPRLAVFFPEGERCEQVNYGQGEGQVLINGREWGFYWNRPDTLDVVVHDEYLPLEEAERIARAICDGLRARLGDEFAYRVRMAPRTPLD